MDIPLVYGNTITIPHIFYDSYNICIKFHIVYMKFMMYMLQISNFQF